MIYDCLGLIFRRRDVLPSRDSTLDASRNRRIDVRILSSRAVSFYCPQESMRITDLEGQTRKAFVRNVVPVYQNRIDWLGEYLSARLFGVVSYVLLLIRRGHRTPPEAKGLSGVVK
jgi:hypothetical protein